MTVALMTILASTDAETAMSLETTRRSDHRFVRAIDGCARLEVTSVPVVRVDPLMLVACELVAGDFDAERLRTIADRGLFQGDSGPVLGELGALDPADAREARDLFVWVLQRLGVELPDADRARWILVRETARAVVDGELPPGVGADKIANWRLNIRDEGDLRIFVGLASMLEDHPEDRDELDRQIIAEAAELLSRSCPRTWIRLRAGDHNSGLTRSEGEEQVDVDPLKLPITDELCCDLEAWVAEHNRVMAGWPLVGGFVSISAADQFVEAGRRLVSRLQRELGANYHVEYWPEPTRPPGVRLRA